MMWPHVRFIWIYITNQAYQILWHDINFIYFILLNLYCLFTALKILQSSAIQIYTNLTSKFNTKQRATIKTTLVCRSTPESQNEIINSSQNKRREEKNAEAECHWRWDRAVQVNTFSSDDIWSYLHEWLNHLPGHVHGPTF